MDWEQKHTALETDLMVAKDAIWGLTERVIDLETEMKSLMATIKGGKNNKTTRHQAPTNKSNKLSKAKAVKVKAISKVKRKSNSRRQKKDPLDTEDENLKTKDTKEVPVAVKVERRISTSNEDSNDDGNAFLNENEAPSPLNTCDIVNVISLAEMPTNNQNIIGMIVEEEIKSTRKRSKRSIPQNSKRTNAIETELQEGSTSQKKYSDSVVSISESDSDCTSSSNEKNPKMETPLKKGDPDPIWLHWKRISAKSAKRVTVQCFYCLSHNQLNHATKCKRHTAVCNQAPKEVRKEFFQYKDYGKGTRKIKSECKVGQELT